MDIAVAFLGQSLEQALAPVALDLDSNPGIGGLKGFCNFLGSLQLNRRVEHHFAFLLGGVDELWSNRRRGRPGESGYCRKRNTNQRGKEVTQAEHFFPSVVSSRGHGSDRAGTA